MKARIKHTIFAILYFFGVHTILRRRQRDVLTILLYHGAAPHVESGIFNYKKKFIAPEVFDIQMRYLQKHYSVLELDSAIADLQAGNRLPPYPLVITFDDGYKDAVEHVEPILKKYDLSATIFVVTNFIGKRIPLWVDRLEYVIGHGKTFANLSRQEKIQLDDETRAKLKAKDAFETEKYLQTLEEENGAALKTFKGEESVYEPLTWEQIAAANPKHLRFGAHTENHPILTKLPLSSAQTEIAASLRELERRIDNPSSVFAYPNGQPDDFSEDIKRSVRELGFTAALTTVSGINTHETDPFAMNRITMDDTESMVSFTMRVTGTEHWIRSILQNTRT